MSWEYLIARKIKESGDKARQNAVVEASAYIGVIEESSPLTVSIVNGAGMYEGNEIIQSRTFKEYGTDIKQKGKKVIVLPIDGLDTIAVVDIAEGGS